MKTFDFKTICGWLVAVVLAGFTTFSTSSFTENERVRKSQIDKSI